MQYRLINLVQEETIVVGLKAESTEEMLRTLVEVLFQQGFVERDFADDVWAREQTYPTGLPTEPLAVAIPHADPSHVLRSAVGIGILAQPVSFGLMGGPNGERIDAHIVFLLAIKETEMQVKMIQDLMHLLQTPSLLTRLVEAETPAEVIQVLV